MTTKRMLDVALKPSLSALLSSDAGIREMASAVVHNYCAISTETLDKETTLLISDTLASALLQLHEGEEVGIGKAAEAEYRMLLALGRLVAQSPQAKELIEHITTNDSLQALLIARGADPLPSFPRIPKLASELCQLIFFP